MVVGITFRGTALLAGFCFVDLVLLVFWEVEKRQDTPYFKAFVFWQWRFLDVRCGFCDYVYILRFLDRVVKYLTYNASRAILLSNDRG